MSALVLRDNFVADVFRMSRLMATRMGDEMSAACGGDPREIASLPATTSRGVLTSILRDGAQRMLAQAVAAEVVQWIDAHEHFQDDRGHRQVIRDDHLPKRTLMTGIGPVEVEQSRVLDRRSDPETERLGLWEGVGSGVSGHS